MFRAAGDRRWGIRAELASGPVHVGTRALLESHGIRVPPELLASAEALARDGQTTVFVADAARVLGIVAVADTLRPTARAAIDRLRELGIGKLTMLTGDNPIVAGAIAAELGLDYAAELLPEDKLSVVQRLQDEGRRVAMVGDGINDAPSLATATLGVSLGTLMVSKIRDTAKNGYFAGCTASFVEPDIAQAATKLLDAAGVEFTTLGKDEMCCGIPMLVAGKWDLWEESLRHNVAAMDRKGVEQVVTSCPACWLVWNTYYPRRGWQPHPRADRSRGQGAPPGRARPRGRSR